MKPTSKLSAETISEIRAARARGESIPAIARRLGVSLATAHKYGRKPDIVATDDMVDRPSESDPLVARLRERMAAEPYPRPVAPPTPAGESHQDVTRAILEAQQQSLLERVKAGEVLSLLDQKRLTEISAKLEHIGGKDPEPEDGQGLKYATRDELRLMLAVRHLEESLEERTATPVLEDPAIGLAVEVLRTSSACAGHAVTHPLDETAARGVLDVVHRHRVGPHGHWTSKTIDRPDAAEVEEFSVKTRDDRP